MKLALTSILFFNLLFFSLKSQELSPRDIHGTYCHQTGLPGQTIKKPDGLEMHLMPVTYTKSELKIKRCGRAQITLVNRMSYGLITKEKYRWELNQDTLTLFHTRNEETENYLMDDDGERVNNLISLENALSGFSRCGDK